LFDLGAFIRPLPPQQVFHSMTEDIFPSVLPHGSVQEVIPGKVYIVQGSFPMMPFVRINRTMCIVKEGNDLIILNSVRVNEETENEIMKLGTIKKLVRLCMAHGVDDAYYVHKFKPRYYSVATSEFSKPDAPADVVLKEDGEMPIKGSKLIILTGIPEKDREAALWIPEGPTLISVDVFQHEGGMEHTSFGGSLLMTLMGFGKPCDCPPLWRNTFGKDKEAIWPDLERIFALEWDAFVSGHGNAMVGGANLAVAANIRKHWGK
jgi:hypothetical protein